MSRVDFIRPATARFSLLTELLLLDAVTILAALLEAFAVLVDLWREALATLVDFFGALATFARSLDALATFTGLLSGVPSIFADLTGMASAEATFSPEEPSILVFAVATLTRLSSFAATLVEPLPAVLADATQLTQLFQNLIGNAIKYRTDRAPDIRVAARSDGEFEVFSVSDNGIGIDRQYFDRIFQMFQRLHTMAEYSGTGIGLTICRKIVERHGGRIWVESVPGEGATFLFSMPRVQRERSAA